MRRITTLQTNFPGGTRAVLAAALLGAALAGTAPSALAQPRELKPVTVVRGLANPWALAFLPDGRMLVTEKAGRIRIADAQGRVSAPLAAAPAMPSVADMGQCGLTSIFAAIAFDGNYQNKVGFNYI